MHLPKRLFVIASVFGASLCVLPNDASVGGAHEPIPEEWGMLTGANTFRPETPGATKGTLTVDKNGASIYSIPLFVVPGTAGMQPVFALAYNSQSNAGIAGYGWSLKGISTITRGRKTLLIDGMAGAVNFDRNDQFYLDGERLVYMGGAPHGYSGAEYRMEHEIFSRIIAQGEAGAGPASFKVWTRDGRLIEYGDTEPSRLRANSADHPLEVQTWAVSRVSDACGNYMNFVYEKYQADGEQYLIRIDYTGNINAGDAP
ncbi:MAG: hypothetical protein LBC18_11350, partial [Opitutaceae bacterium]|nr:hypothetical protein [Opitutaceae bacterium]